MPDEVPNGKPKPAPEPPSVLGTLPTTRPERLGAPRAKARRNGAPAPSATAKKAPKRTAKPAARPHHGPTAVRPGSPPLKRHQRPTDAPPPRPVDPPRGTQLVTTAIKATGELAQIGLTYGGHLVKRAVDRIPRP